MKKITALLLLSIIFSSCISNTKTEIITEPTFKIKGKNIEKDILTGSILEKKNIEKISENKEKSEEKIIEKNIITNEELKPYFKIINNKIIVIFSGKNINADIATFKKLNKNNLKNDILFFNKSGMYSDKNSLYYFPVDGEWTKLKLNLSTLKKVNSSNYFYDGSDNVFFQNRVIETIFLDKKNPENLKTIGKYLLILNDKLFYQGKKQLNFGINLNNIRYYSIKIKNGNINYFIENNRIFFLNYDKIEELKGVNTDTFKVINETFCEDENNKYEFEYGHYGFEIKIIKKEDINKELIIEKGIKINFPKNYTISKNTEKNRRGSFVSYDFKTEQLDFPQINEIQLFSKESIKTFNEKCENEICFFGDYPNSERYNNQKNAINNNSTYGKYKLKKFNNRNYLVSNHKCNGDSCVMREYTTFIDDTKIDIWIVIKDNTENNKADRLFENFYINKLNNSKNFGNGLVLKKINSENFIYFLDKKIYKLNENEFLEDNFKILNNNFKIFEITSKNFIVGNIILDKKNNKIYKTKGGSIQKIELGKNGLYTLKHYPGGGTSVGVIDFKGEEKIIHKLEDIKTSIYDFELLIDKKMKIFYTGMGNKKEEITLDLN